MGSQIHLRPAKSQRQHILRSDQIDMCTKREQRKPSGACSKARRPLGGIYIRNKHQNECRRFNESAFASAFGSFDKRPNVGKSYLKSFKNTGSSKENTRCPRRFFWIERNSPEIVIKHAHVCKNSHHDLTRYVSAECIHPRLFRNAHWKVVETALLLCKFLTLFCPWRKECQRLHEVT